MDEVAERCLQDIGEQNFSDVNEFISFLKKVEIQIGPKSDTDHDNDSLSDLDDKISPNFYIKGQPLKYIERTLR